MKARLVSSFLVIVLGASGTLTACTPEPAPIPIPPGIPFAECVEASSFKDYYQKVRIEEAGFPFNPEWMDAFLEPIPIPVRINFPDVEVYTIPLERAGGDVYTYPIIKTGNLYCPLIDSNAEILFAPVHKDEAVDYLIFRLVTLGETGYQYERYTIFVGEDYETYFCEEPAPESERRVTTVQETPKGSLINWVYFTPVGERAGCYEYKVEVGYDGKIQFLEGSDGLFIDCGPGGIF